MNIINENTDIQNIDLSFLNTVKKKKQYERSYIIELFQNEINKERIGTKFKKLPFIAIQSKLSHIEEKSTLYYFLSVCKDYKNRNGSFSKCFFGSLKVKSPLENKE